MGTRVDKSSLVRYGNDERILEMQDELEAMSQLARLLEPLEAAARARVLAWAIGAFSVEGVAVAARHSGNRVSGEKLGRAENSVFATFAELFHAAAPRSEKEKALVAAYWLQQSSGVDQFASQQLNTELKHIGYGVVNITDALNQLINDRPSFIIQLTKSGSSKQARKTYKITDAGLRRVAEMLNAENGEPK